MKRAIIGLLIFSLLFALVSCGGGGSSYEPVPSTEEESRVVMTLSFGDNKYDVKYELYRALFLTYADEISGGNDTVWSGPDKDVYVKKINELIAERAADIYSVFAVCEHIGFDLHSSKVDKRIDEYIKESVEGSGSVIGYGSYEKYLEALERMNLNYSVQTLLFRYAIGLEAIDEHYIGTFDADDIKDEIKFGELTYDADDVKEYYYSEECKRVLRAHIQASSHYEPIEYAERVRDKMITAAESGESAVANVVINTGLTAPTEVQRGYVMGRYNLDSLYYSRLTDAAMGLSVGDVSEVISVHNGDEEILYILYCAEKSDEHFEEAYSEIAYVYLTNAVGEIINNSKLGLNESTEFTSVLEQLDFSRIIESNAKTED